MFSVYLTLSTSGDTSRLIFGGHSQELVDKSISFAGLANRITDYPASGIYWMKNQSEHHWQLKMSNAQIDDKRMFLF